MGRGPQGPPSPPSQVRPRQGWAGLACRRQVTGASTWWRWGGGLRASLGEAWGLGGVRGQTVACFLPSASRLADCFSASVCVYLLLCPVSAVFSSPGTSTPPAIAATPVSAIPAALGVNGYSPVPTQPTGQPAPDALYPNGVHPYPGGVLCPPAHCAPQQPSPPPLTVGSQDPPFLSRLRGDRHFLPLCHPGQGCSFPVSAREAEA